MKSPQKSSLPSSLDKSLTVREPMIFFLNGFLVLTLLGSVEASANKCTNPDYHQKISQAMRLARQRSLPANSLEIGKFEAPASSERNPVHFVLRQMMNRSGQPRRGILDIELLERQFEFVSTSKIFSHVPGEKKSPGFSMETLKQQVADLRQAHQEMRLNSESIASFYRQLFLNPGSKEADPQVVLQRELTPAESRSGGHEQIKKTFYFPLNAENFKARSGVIGNTQVVTVEYSHHLGGKRIAVEEMIYANEPRARDAFDSTDLSVESPKGYRLSPLKVPQVIVRISAASPKKGEESPVENIFLTATENRFGTATQVEWRRTSAVTGLVVEMRKNLEIKKPLGFGIIRPRVISENEVEIYYFKKGSGHEDSKIIVQKIRFDTDGAKEAEPSVSSKTLNLAEAPVETLEALFSFESI